MREAKRDTSMCFIIKPLYYGNRKVTQRKEGTHGMGGLGVVSSIQIVCGREDTQGRG